jgi:putative methylase
MKTSQLSILLSHLDGFEDPETALEQYMTPSKVAADLLNQVRLQRQGGSVTDLGCGTGILTIGAAALGYTATGVEKDGDALDIAHHNLRRAQERLDRELDVTFTESDVQEYDQPSDTVIMNPPFGIQQEDANLIFLEQAFQLTDHTFALLHRSGERQETTRQFIKDFASNQDVTTSILKTYTFRLPATMEFHSREQKRIDVDLYYFRSRAVDER